MQGLLVNYNHDSISSSIVNTAQNKSGKVIAKFPLITFPMFRGYQSVYRNDLM